MTTPIRASYGGDGEFTDPEGNRWIEMIRCIWCEQDLLPVTEWIENKEAKPKWFTHCSCCGETIRSEEDVVVGWSFAGGAA